MKLFTLTKNGKLVRREYDPELYTPIRIEASQYCIWLRLEKGVDYGGSHNSESSSDILRCISDEDIVVYDGQFAGITAVADYVEHNGPGEAKEKGRRCILTDRAAKAFPDVDAKAIRSGEFYSDDDHCRWGETKLELLQFPLNDAIIKDDIDFDFNGIILLAKPAVTEIVYHLMQEYSEEKVSFDYAKKLCCAEDITSFIVLIDGKAKVYCGVRISDSQEITGVECYGVEENLGISKEEFFGMLNR